jgi:V/A-type H+-transporting ATPase subunit K
MSIGITIAAGTASAFVRGRHQVRAALPIAAMPGTQGIYGHRVLVVVFFNILSGQAQLAGPAGFQVFLACQPVGWLCMISGVYQGRTGSSAAGIVAAGKRAPALVFPALVETYAILSLIVTILMLLGLQAAYVK